MPEKVVILEVKEAYALAMTEGGSVIRIRRKEGLAPGDEVYILPEDYWEDPANTKVIPFAAGKSSGKWLRRATAMAAMLALVLILMVPLLPTKAYAVVSFDGRRGVQMQVDKNYKILDVESCDGSIPSEELAQMKGKNLMDLGADIPSLLGKGPILIAYAPQSGEEDLQAEAQLRSLFADQELVYFSGSCEDISQADASAKSLGKYLLDGLVDQEQLQWLSQLFEDDYEDDDLPEEPSDTEDAVQEAYGALDADALLEVLKNNPSYRNSEAFRELLADKLEEKHEQGDISQPDPQWEEDEPEDQDGDDGEEEPEDPDDSDQEEPEDDAEEEDED